MRFSAPTGHDGVASRVRKAEAILSSSIVAGELLYGFRNGSRYAENREQLDAFLANPHVTFMPVTLRAAERFGLITAALRKHGTPIPVDDIWIAAHSLESGADLLSFDAHFNDIAGLSFIHLVDA